MLNRRVATLGIASACTACRPAAAQLASAPVRWIVPFPPGGPVDVVARKLAETVSSATGTIITVENKAGANGSIGTAEALRAAPDGRTFALAIPDSLISIASLLKSPPYDARRDLTLVSQLVASPLVMMASADLAVGSMAELMGKAKKATEPLSYGSWGAGTMPHLIMAAVESASASRFTHIPYRGVAPALQDLAAGQVKLGFGPAHVAAQYAQKGLASPIALTGPSRIALLPGVATFSEQGFTGAIEQSRVWVGLVGPKGLPIATVAKWNLALDQAVRNPAIGQFLASIGFVPISNGPAEFAQNLGRELISTTQLIKKLGIAPN